MEADEIVVIFAKPAVPGRVKTRLVPPFSADDAARFHLALLEDVVRLVETAGLYLELHVSGGQQACGAFRSRYPRHPVRPQQGSDLGKRLQAAFTGIFERGFQRAVVLGSDHPTLPPTLVNDGLERLTTVDTVFGPCRDGGYYLVGIRSTAWPDATGLFEEIPWSSSVVLERTLQRARQRDLSVQVLPEWYDIDRPEDLEHLRRDADPDSVSARLLSSLMGERTP